MTQLRNSRTPFLLKSDVNLFNHLLGKADVAVVVLWRVLFFVDMRLFVFGKVADLYCLKLFLRC